MIMDARAAALGGRLSGVCTTSVAVVMVPIIDHVDGEDQAAADPGVGGDSVKAASKLCFGDQAWSGVGRKLNIPVPTTA
jgi:hypothetical protein